MKKSISVKMFITTLVVMTIFITLTLYLQSYFFQDFYIRSKMDRLESNTKKIINQLQEDNIGSSVEINSILDFEENNNAKIFFAHKVNGGIKFSFINEEAKFNDDARFSEEAIFGSDSLFGFDKNNMRTLSKLRDLLTDLSKPSNEIENIFELQHPITLPFHDPNINTQNIAYIMSTSNTETIIVISSLQPVKEASEVIKEFYIYVLFGLLIIIIILSFINSNMITKPLVRLNRTAKKMSKMDFSAKCEVLSQDEIGSLATTLNFLSQNLNAALIDLQQRNLQLEKDIEKERQLERMRKEFVAGVSHELKTPIALISGYAEGIRDNIASEESKEFYVDVIMDEANKMSNLVSDMLDLSQLESGNFKLKMSEIFVDQLLKNLINRHKQFIEQKNITLTQNISEDLLVVADKLRIEQVVTNFITNAIRHTPNNGEIRVETVEAEDLITIQIENSGENIPENELENIWNKFYKVDKSRSRTSGGTGLGLSIVKNIMQLHESNFGVKNTPTGVSFYFTLRKIG